MEKSKIVSLVSKVEFNQDDWNKVLDEINNKQQYIEELENDIKKLKEDKTNDQLKLSFLLEALSEKFEIQLDIPTSRFNIFYTSSMDHASGKTKMYFKKID